MTKRRGKKKTKGVKVYNCCCRYGAAVSGEWPEFECRLCPVHRGAFADGHLCSRHREETSGDDQLHG